MERVILSALLVLFLTVQVSSFSRQVSSTNTSYVITVPKTFRPGMLVNMNVLILKADPPDAPVNVTATFVIDSVLIATTAGQFHVGVTSSLQLAIPTKGLPNGDPSSGTYRSKEHLQVIGSGGLTFNTTESNGISFSKKGFSIYVQTDKGIYKPGQTVNMRIVAVYPDLKVYMGKMDIEITDPLQNTLAYWKDEKTSGIVTKEFELSSQSNIGNWEISVEIEGSKEKTDFEVKEYVLPKFKVEILSKSYVSSGKGDIRGSVSAKYTYGKGVKGKAKMFVYPPCRSSIKTCQPDISEFVIDGTHSFSIPKKKIIDLFKRISWTSDPYHGYQVVVNVTVTDELTQKIQFGDTTIRLLRSGIVLKYSDSNPKAFKPDFPFEALIEVTRPDSTPVTDGKTKVEVSTWYNHNESNTFKKATYTPDENGYIVVRQTIAQNVNYLTIKAQAVDEYGKNADSVYKTLSKFQSKSGTFLTLTAADYEVESGNEIVCNVRATEAFSSFNYMVLSRGNIIVSNSVSQSPRVSSTTFKLRASNIMSPSARIISYFVRDNGEIVADSVTVKVNGAFENDVSVEFSAEVREPGEKVDINVKASPYSQVGLLAIDQSVLLLNKGNDFSVAKVMQDLDNYGGDSSNSFPPWWRRKRSIFLWYPSAQNSREIFERAGVTVLTDSADFKPPPVYVRKFFMMDLDREMLEKTSANGNVPALKEVKKVRTFFPETWLWQNVETNALGQAKVSTKSPDTITSWVLSGFAVSNITGFGVADEKPQLRVFQPFFVSMDLPYSVIRGEQVAIKVTVFNYETTEMEVTVRLKSSDDWNNLVKSNSVIQDVVSVIKVSANSGAAVSFPIVPVKLGNIPITISAQSTTSSDSVERNLLVEPEGVEQEYSYSLLLDFDKTTSLSKELELAVPSNVVKGSARATVSVIGDIMGSSINGIEKLLKMPYGCGEQNMVNFAPSMFIRAYLETVGQLTPSIAQKSIKFMMSGYQRELTYQHHDGSYSAFGERFGKKVSGSLWLTAFVVKSFSRAKSYIYIDPKSLEKSIQFMLSRQQKDGSFTESGSVSSYLQGGLKSTNEEALTAYVLVSLLETGKERSQAVKQGISSAVQFLKNKLKTITDVYTLAIVAYAMELADDPAKETALDELMKKAIREDGTLHWTDKMSDTKSEQRWFRPYYKPRSADVEITSYVLLVYAHKREKVNGLPIARWLAQQRNSLGGYSSTQDTVVGLQALSEFAPLIFSPDISFIVDVKLSPDATFQKSFEVNKDNMIVLQEAELPDFKGNVLSITGSGKGIGVLQVGVTYNIDKAPTENSFDIDVKVLNADNNNVEASSCVKYIGDGEKSGMAILEVGLPSGFNVDQDDINALLSSQNNIKRIETSGRKTVLYFDEVLKKEALCVTLKSVRTHAVGKAQPIPVVIYDYYKPEKRATTMYATQENVNLCEVCFDCTDCEKVVAASNIMSSVSQFLMVVFAIMVYNLY